MHMPDPGFGLFPISDYYKPHIEDAMTITRAGNWWSAALLIRDPRSNEPFIALYRWQKVGDVWKNRGRFFIRKTSDLQSVVSVMSGWAEQLPA